MDNKDNFCLQLLTEYPFNAFFVNLVCYIRDSLFKHFEQDRTGEAATVDAKQYALVKERFLDFEAQMEPVISILRDMCNTSDPQFNDFVRNIIVRWA